MSNEVPIILLIVAIPVYFLTKWILRKSKLGNEKSKKYLAIIPIVVITPLIYAGIITIWILSVSYYPKVDFNEQEWNKNKDEKYKMSNDIIKVEY